MGTSNHLIGFLNFVSFLLAVPIIGGGVWLSSRANTTDCMKFLQWPLILIGGAVMVVSLAGIAGACYRNNFLMYLYLWVMFFVIVALLGFVIFAYSVTERGSGRPVMNRVYLDYSLQDYSGWLADRVSTPKYWTKISSCIRDSHVCRNLHRNVGGLPESADSFYLRKLTSIEFWSPGVSSFLCKLSKDIGSYHQFGMLQAPHILRANIHERDVLDFRRRGERDRP
ncbi:hypothetical protein ACS0TY_014949 [Phlomoides rotata]